MTVRKGYILLHRKGITKEEWKTPERTLAWFDLLTMVDHKTGMVTVNYTFYEARWRTARSTIHKWVRHWEGERMIERTGERDSERNGERYFVVRYAEYQLQGEQEGEQEGERNGEQEGEPRYKVSSSKLGEVSKGKVAKATADHIMFATLLFDGITATNEAEATMHAKNPDRRAAKIAQWAEDIEKLQRIDGANPQQIAYMLKWLFSGMKNAQFWQKNIRSGAKLRAQWATLVANCKEDIQKKQGGLTMPNFRSQSSI